MAGTSFFGTYLQFKCLSIFSSSSCHCTTVLPYLWGLHSKTPNECLWSWILSDSKYKHCDTTTLNLITKTTTKWLTGG
jgi:hypothetical protein